MPYLTDEELLEIAKPLKQKKAICRWFERNGFGNVVKPNGMPLVPRPTTPPVEIVESDKVVPINKKAWLARFGEKSRKPKNMV